VALAAGFFFVPPFLCFILANLDSIKTALLYIAPRNEMLAPDTLLQDRYRILSLIKPGNMGAVYVAEDTRLGNKVALKETFSGSNEAMLREQFHREARLLSRLHHTSLPRVTDHFIEGSGQFLVMDYIVGTDLMELLEHNAGPFPVNRVLDWADQLLDVLTYLHAQYEPVVHRDIKPANIKLTPHGKVILLDFGLAKGATNSMLMSLPAATMAYAPIEQVLGQGTDPRSDLYSLGVTMYHLLTNTFPPLALKRQEATWRGLPDPLPSADYVNAQVPEAIARVLTKAMALGADDRLQTAARMRELLREATRLSIAGDRVAPVLFKTQEVEGNSYETPLLFPADQLPTVRTLAADDLPHDVIPARGESELAAEKARVKPPEDLRTVNVVEDLMPAPFRLREPVQIALTPPADEANERQFARTERRQTNTQRSNATAPRRWLVFVGIIIVLAALIEMLAWNLGSKSGPPQAELITQAIVVAIIIVLIVLIGIAVWTIFRSRKRKSEDILVRVVAAGANEGRINQTDQARIDTHGPKTGGRKRWLVAVIVLIAIIGIGIWIVRSSQRPPLAVAGVPENEWGATFTEPVRGISIEMVEVPAGEFLMGSPNSEAGRYSVEGPQHKVTVSSFYMGKYEVTQAQWSAVATALPKVNIDLKPGPSHFTDDNIPVEQVSWEEAREFCERISLAIGKAYRLPTEAEWEYACRATTTGSYAGDLGAMGWCTDNSGAKTHRVGVKRPNGFGLYDLYGNVWEWCIDTWHENYYGAATDGTAWTSGDSGRVLRGGSWLTIARDCRSAFRARKAPDNPNSLIGFRVVASGYHTVSKPEHGS
jgi:formylglycine-generating enzyme required for sulfatase activity/serine/threonine protein kinase